MGDPAGGFTSLRHPTGFSSRLALPFSVDSLRHLPARETREEVERSNASVLGFLLQAVDLAAMPRPADERTTNVELTTKGRDLRRRALKIPPAVIDRLGVELEELAHLHEVLTRINGAALAAGALDSELDR